ncbi:MAG: chorismate lyase [Gammaproteobacteria bacterium]|nr:chorismate lyase [Gammaproteobacteria bacterium]
MKFSRRFPTVPHGVVPAHYLPWLLDTASLTRRLVYTCAGAFRVQLLSQAWERPRLDEALALGMRARDRALVRQVRLLCDERPWVYARTLLPRTTLTGAERRLAHLRSRSLGAVLFADPTMRRGRTEIVRLCPTDGLYAFAAQPLAAPPAEIWGRRTVFRLRGKPLLVSEFFLPGIGDLKL